MALTGAAGLLFPHRILGYEGYIPTAKAVEVLGGRYTLDQSFGVVSSAPDEMKLRWMGDNGFMLIPGPPDDMNLMEVLNVAPYLFPRRANQGRWFTEDIEVSFRTEVVSAARWLVLSRSCPEVTKGLSWSRQLSFVQSPLRSATLVEMVYALSLYYRVYNRLPATGFLARTSSVDKCGRHVTVSVVHNAIHIFPTDNNTASPMLGLATILDL